MRKISRRSLFKFTLPFSFLPLADVKADSSLNIISGNEKLLKLSEGDYLKKNYEFSAALINTPLEVNLEEVLKNGFVTPNMFYNKDDFDWHPAFEKAATISNKLSLPVTLLPTVYNFSTSLDLTIFRFGFNCAGDRNNKVVFKAIGNESDSPVFILLKNVDRRKTGGFLIDADGFYDTAFDTSWTKTGGPSLMMVWEKIQIQGWKKTGWVANNNNDVWNKNITILNTRASDTDAIAYFNHSAGGPVSFEGCSFSDRIKVTAQHISALFCIFRGVEIKEGGSSWNVFSSLGSHFFKDKFFKSCFIFTGAVQGFTITGGLIEPTNGGHVFLGLGEHAALNCGAITLQGVRISSYNKDKPAQLAAGNLKNEHGDNIIKISGGILELYSYEIKDLGWVDVLELENVLINVNETNIVNRKITKSGWAYSLANANKVNVPSHGSKLCTVNNLHLTLISNDRDFGEICFLNPKKTLNSKGVIKIIYTDDTGYAEFQYKRKNGNTIIREVFSFYTESSRKINVGIVDDKLMVGSNRSFNSSDDEWSVTVSYSGLLDYLP